MFGTADSALCPHHDRQQVFKRRQVQAVAKSLTRGLDDFTTPDAVTVFLSNLLREVIHKRIDRRDAATMAYISQLLMQATSRSTATSTPNGKKKESRISRRGRSTCVLGDLLWA